VIVSNPFSPGSWTRDQIDRVSRGWWILLVTGIISIVAGGVVLFTKWTVGDLAVFIGVVLVVRGVVTMFSVPIDGAVKNWSIASGLLEVLVGVAVFVWPGPTLLVIAFIIGWYVLFAGVTTVAGAIAGRGVLPYWGLILATGIVETVFGFWLLGQPGLTLVAIVLAIGLWSVIYGVMQLVLAFEVKEMPNRAARLGSDLSTVTALPQFEDAVAG
jgi:uncharacterized membrane protein HdeD (DUF308 family)